MALQPRCSWTWVCVMVGVTAPMSVVAADNGPATAKSSPPFANKFPAGGMFYVGWTGADNLPGAVAVTRLNRLLSEPELQRLGDTGTQLLLAAMMAAFSPGADAEHLLENETPPPRNVGPPIDPHSVASLRTLGLLLTRNAWAIQIYKAGGNAEEIASELALIVDDPRGNVAENFAPLLAKLPTIAPGGVMGTARLSGSLLRTWTPKLDGPEKIQLPVLHWGTVAGKFVVALGAEYAAQIASSLKADPGVLPQFKPLSADAEFVLVTGRLAAENAALTVYVDGARLRESIGDIAAGVAGSTVPAGPARSAAAATARTACSGVLARLGLTELAGAGLAIDFTAADTRHVAFLHTVGKRSGLLALFGGESANPITADTLKAVPSDTNGFCAVDCDWRAMYELLVGTLALIPGGPGEELEAALKEFKDRSGVDPVRQLLGSLGSQTLLLNVPRIGGDGFLTPVLLVEIRKPQTLRRAEEGFTEFLKREVLKNKPDEDDATWRRRRRQEVTTSTVAGRTMRCCELGKFFPWAPSWAVTERYLVVGLHAQSVAAMVRHLESQTSPTPAANITTNPAFAEARRRLPAHDGLAVLSWGDAPSNYPTVSTFLFLIANLLATQRVGAQQTAELYDFADLPATDIIVKYLVPTIEQVRVLPDGLMLETRGTLTGLLDSPVFMGPFPGLIMPGFYLLFTLEP